MIDRSAASTRSRESLGGDGRQAPCKLAGVEQVDAGPKGAVLSFRDNTPPNPERLIGYIQRNFQSMKLRPDQKLVCLHDWTSAEKRVKGVTQLLSDLASLID